VGFGIAQDVVYNTASFDTGNDMFHEDADIGHELMLPLSLPHGVPDFEAFSAVDRWQPAQVQTLGSPYP
jgi:hypothetical protein